MSDPTNGPRTGPTAAPGIWQRCVGFGFRLLYQELAWTYDGVAWLVSFGHWQEWAQTAIPYLIGPRVLELGHGPGHLLAALDERGFRPVGLDASPQMVRLANRRLRISGSALSIVRARAQDLPFRAREFDSVVTSFPTSFITEPATLMGIARVVRPGGRLVAVMGARLTRRNPLYRFVEWLYFVTGQRETVDTHYWEASCAAAGLIMHQFSVNLGSSQILLLVADRPTPNDRD